MNYGTIKWNDIADGTGVRVSLFVSGCRYHCEGCHNPESQDFAFGERFTEETREAVLQGLSHVWIEGLTILGGEPLEPENQTEVLRLISDVRRIYGTKKNIWLYTGGVLEKIWEDNPFGTVRQILCNIDVLVDGPFVMRLRDPGLAFRGSSNQRIINMNDFKRGEPQWNLTEKLSRR